MDSKVAQKLIELNQQFYQTFAEHFSITRQRLQPGVRKVIRKIPPDQQVLDLGCGNGQLWLGLARQGHFGGYIGLDSNPAFLNQAAKAAYLNSNLAPPTQNPLFTLADLSRQDWDCILPGTAFDHILSFANLHHLPGKLLVTQFLKQVNQLLNSNGHFIFSVWQFLNSPRLTARIQDWNTVGLSEDQVDPGDYLLDWRYGGHGLRYVHHYSQEELLEIAELCGFRVYDSFLSDGKGNNLSLYQDWVLAL